MADVYLREGSAIYQARLRVGDDTIRKSTGLRCPKAAQAEADRLEQELTQALVLDTDLTLWQAMSSDGQFYELRRHPFLRSPGSRLMQGARTVRVGARLASAGVWG